MCFLFDWRRLTTFIIFQHLNKERTSTNAWCVDDCYENNVTQTVLNRLENITGIPDTNSEYLQLLRVCHCFGCISIALSALLL